MSSLSVSKSNIKSQKDPEPYDPKLDDINVSAFIPIQLIMIPTPRESKIKFIDFEESQSDEESSETQRKKRIEEKTVEKSVNFTIVIADFKISKKRSHKLLGIDFPNGSIIYHKVEKGTFSHLSPQRGGVVDGTYLLSRSNNILLHLINGKLNYFGLFDKEKCDICNIPLKKAYRCYDCHPKKRKHLTCFCKACYIKRDHTSHRAIALQYNDDLFADFPDLAKL